MEIGKIVGQVVSTARHSKLPQMTFLLVDIIDVDGNVLAPHQVAVDSIGAGLGEWVLLIRGSSARMAHDTEVPVDLSIVGIVDQITSGRESLYTK
ncbi:EutN/CcmL family microcompartment protein [Desulfospira joergensenii]|uniref:EutN/CcmL family microcompartment protein n=1 Tax=Desulfospira joergensenii TaxID=53329 RepID=UPI000413C0A2|nr:EutN/CcmL family microcompartment protein [Desulfospira joergensenii]